MKDLKLTSDNYLDQIYPVIFNNKLVFLDKKQDKFYIYSDNKIEELEKHKILDEIVQYPDNTQELHAMISTIDFIYNRFLYSDLNELQRNFFNIILKIKGQQEKNKVKFMNFLYKD